MISAFARARKCWTTSAIGIAPRGKIPAGNLYEEKSKLLYRNYRGGRSDLRFR